MPTGLREMKDLILPALWSRDPNGRSDIIINFEDDRLDIAVNGRSSPLLTRQEIEQELWKGGVLSDRINEALRKGTS